jgi:hypothetical protein
MKQSFLTESVTGEYKGFWKGFTHKRQRVRCKYCGTFLTLKNVTILPNHHGGYIDLICDSPLCLSKWLRIEEDIIEEKVKEMKS